MKSAEIRDIAPRDFDRVLALNTAEVQWTSPMNQEKLEQLVSLATYAKVMVAGPDNAGFLIAMASGCDYRNENYAWFSARYAHFLYVDRIVIDQTYAGAGLGKLFYNDVFAFARENACDSVVCEYNIVPLNEASRAFHTKMGFTEVGQRKKSTSEAQVSMQYRPFASA